MSLLEDREDPDEETKNHEQDRERKNADASQNEQDEKLPKLHNQTPKYKL